MENDSELSKVAAPGTSVTVSLPALTISLFVQRERKISDMKRKGLRLHAR
jgi:hypothetical protein